MVEKCETDCKQTGGAIFCDGQFINADNADSCADELEAEVKIEIDIDAAIDTVEDTADDVGEKTEQTADCVDEKVCAVSNVGAGQGGGGLFALAPVGLALLWRLRRRSASR
jgi:MYXO-CTERM domain-containing protein